jgi:U3 small nucleolar RNA-associated protein MPP10
VLKRVARSLKAAERSNGELLPGVPADSEDDDADADADEEEDEDGSDGAGDADEEEEEDGGEGGEGEEEEEEEDDEFGGLRRAARAGARPQRKRLPTEDGFFKLSDMERCARSAHTHTHSCACCTRARAHPQAHRIFRLLTCHAVSASHFRFRSFVQDAEEAELAGGAGGSDGDAGGSGGSGGDDDSDDDGADDLFTAGAGGGGGGGAGGSSDDDLDALIAHTAGVAGGSGKDSAAAPKRKTAAAAAAAAKTKPKSAKAKSGSGAGDADGGGGLMYEDFFGPRPGRKSGSGDDGGDGWGDEYREGPPEGEEGDDVAGGADEEEEGDEMEEGEEEEEDEEGRADGGALPVSRGRGSRRGKDLLASSSSDEGDALNPSAAPQSAQARRAARLAAQIAELEGAAMGEKRWHMRGEVRAGDRPLNSALEVSMDFEHASAPPPVVTAEATASLEEMIRARCAEARWDDVARKAAPGGMGKKRKEVLLSDEKSKKGLGELYEEDYLKVSPSRGRRAPPAGMTWHGCMTWHDCVDAWMRGRGRAMHRWRANARVCVTFCAFAGEGCCGRGCGRGGHRARHCRRRRRRRRLSR